MIPREGPTEPNSVHSLCVRLLLALLGRCLCCCDARPLTVPICSAACSQASTFTLYYNSLSLITFYISTSFLHTLVLRFYSTLPLPSALMVPPIATPASPTGFASAPPLHRARSHSRRGTKRSRSRRAEARKTARSIPRTVSWFSTDSSDLCSLQAP